MYDLYNFMQWQTDYVPRKNNWLGNLRWFVREMEEAGHFRFSVIPVDREHSSLNENGVLMNFQTLFDVKVSPEHVFSKVVYTADSIQLENESGEKFKMTLPWESYGAMFQFENITAACHMEIFSVNVNPRQRNQEGGDICFESGPYTLFVQSKEGNIREIDNKINMEITSGTSCAVAFHVKEEEALWEVKNLYEQSKLHLEKSKKFWNDYLTSCPVVEFPEGYRYKVDGKKEEFYSGEEIHKRQLWLWWCALVNMNKVEFNKEPIYMAPDKTNWPGTWSNDGPETLAALSLTNAGTLVRECMIAYLSDSIDGNGDLSWYTWYDGNGCREVKGDVGQYSHGVPSIVHTVGFYIENTGDTSVLDEVIRSGRTVWETLCIYMRRVFSVRDINQDGLVEWMNLWETGWDDKLGTFFESADLDTWMNMVVNMDEQEYEKFCLENAHPVTAIVEQVYMLWALHSMIKMSRIKNDKNTEDFCLNRLTRIQYVLNTRHWDEEAQFYYDWDVRKNALSKAKNADAFYYLYFEKKEERKEQLMKTFWDPEEFGTLYCPMSSKKNKGFSELGYWSGGHWPREMGYLALGFNKAGFEKDALDVLIRAICCEEGNIVPEVMNPITGLMSTDITKMAYDVMNNVALLECFGKCKWCEEE